MTTFNFADLANEDGTPEVAAVPQPFLAGVAQAIPEHAQLDHEARMAQVRMNHQKLEEELQANAERRIKADARSQAKDITSLSHAYNTHPDEVRKHVTSLPTTDRQLVDLLAKLFLKDYIFIADAKGGYWYFWDGTMYVKQNDRKFSAHLTAGCEEFMNYLVKGYFKVLAHNEIELPKEEKRGRGRPKKNAEVEVVEISPEELKTLERNTYIIEHFNKVVAFKESLASQKSHYNMASAIQDKRHKAADYFVNDSQYIVDINGMVLDTSDLTKAPMKPSPERPIARKLNVSFDGIDTHPEKWQQALDSWFPNDPETQRYLQVAVGAALLGRGDTRHIPSLFGERRTGKSTFVKIFMDLFGGYARKVNREFIAQKSGTNFMRSQAQGVRFLLLEETDKFDLADNGFMKELAGGGGTLTTERKGIDAEEWPIQCVLFIATNFRIKVDVSDDAIMERVNYVEFKHQFKEEDAETVFALDKVLVEEAGSTILRWALEGAEYWSRPEVTSFPKSDAIRAQEGKAKMDGSSVIEWLTASCEAPVSFVGHQYQYQFVGDETPRSSCVPRSEAYSNYKQWCMVEGYDKPLSLKAFTDHIISHLPNGKLVRSNGVRIQGLGAVALSAHKF